MSEAAVIAAHVPIASGAPPAAAAEGRRREIDLYAEGNSFAAPDTTDRNLFGADGIGFRDLLDIVNPLHHLPVVGTLYRAVTGDALAPGSRILGGTLFGGIGGFVVSLVNAVLENETGSDLGDKALALLRDDAHPIRHIAEAAPVATAASRVPADTPAAAETPPPQPERHSFPIYAGPAVDRAAKAAASPAPAVALANATPERLASDAPPPDVALMMRNALEKYEALMKSRAGPSISGEF